MDNIKKGMGSCQSNGFQFHDSKIVEENNGIDDDFVAEHNN